MATSSQNGHSNGLPANPVSQRFADIPNAIDVPVQGDQDDEAVEVDLGELVDDPSELCTLFENEGATRSLWMTVSLAYAKQNKIDHAIEMLNRAAGAMNESNHKDRLTIITCLCWMYLWKSREAPRVAPDSPQQAFDAADDADAKTKDTYLQLATASLNDASRINPAFPPLFLARGVLQLLKAFLQAPSKVPAANGVDPNKAELLHSAIKAFDQAGKVSQGKNMLAVLGRARANFSLTRYREALADYQTVLSKMPDLVDPDPRIGIGCCFWQLGFKDDAKQAWDRTLEISPQSKIANILLGLYYLDASGRVPTSSPDFIRLYKKAMTEYTQKSFKADKSQPLTCATFAGYFLSSKNFSYVESLANKAIQFTDVHAIASDGWYLLARKEHYNGNIELATNYYRRADEARGGMDRGYLPAKFGVAQLSVMNNDLGEAKLRLEKIIQGASRNERNYEAMILLGTLYAEEVFAGQITASKEDKSAEMRKAIEYLEMVRTAWKDPKKNMSPDSAVLLNLARLYEAEHPEKALQCLQQVEQIEMDQVAATEQQPAESKDDVELRNSMRRNLPPQLLNNIGCFYSQAEKYELASEMFEAALGACVRIGEKGEDTDTDALLTTISFNLGRSYEYQNLTDKAMEVYEKLVARHDDYTDAQARLAYIKLRKNPNKEGPDAVAKLYQGNSTDLDIRALYGWYLGKVNSRKRPANVSEDPEFRHYKHTLLHHDKHDRYALVGMGNLHMMSAREMRRDNDQAREKRSAQYTRAVEFFDKALQLDPKNAYAAQGIAIALVEDKKDYKAALPIFLKVRETVKDANVYINLGHIYAELKQFSKAIESYEIALTKDGKDKDPGVLACLGRTWLNRGRHSKHESNQDAFKTALEYANKALALSPDQVHFKFNVAFVQIQLVQHIMGVGENHRSVAMLQEASEGLEAAIVALDEIATHPQPPYPKADLEQRANMARNTQRKQLGRQIESQKEYEEKNKEKLAEAKQQQQARMQQREEEKQRALAKEQERVDKLRKEREEILAKDRKIAEERDREERERQAADMTTDSETGERVKRKRKTKPSRADGEGGGGGGGGGEKKPKSQSKPRKKKGTAGRRKQRDDDDDDDDGRSDVEDDSPKKKRKLAPKKENSKYKSAELVVDSSSDGEGVYGGGGGGGGDDDEDELERAEKALEGDRGSSPAASDDDGGSSRRRGGGKGRSRRKSSARVEEDDDEDEDLVDKMDVDEDEQRATGAANGDDDEDEETTTRAPRGRRRGKGAAVLEDSDEDEELTAGAGADTSMADGGDDDDDE